MRALPSSLLSTAGGKRREIRPANCVVLTGQHKDAAQHRNVNESKKIKALVHDLRPVTPASVASTAAGLGSCIALRAFWWLAVGLSS